jgi:hypothetical protein
MAESVGKDWIGDLSKIKLGISVIRIIGENRPEDP